MEIRARSLSLYLARLFSQRAIVLSVPSIRTQTKWHSYLSKKKAIKRKKFCADIRYATDFIGRFEEPQRVSDDNRLPSNSKKQSAFAIIFLFFPRILVIYVYQGARYICTCCIRKVRETIRLSVGRTLNSDIPLCLF